MARHRSPHGRRALPRPLLPSVAATVGGAHRSTSAPQLWSTSSLPARFVVTAVAGSAVAAAGQQVLVQAVPTAADGTAALRTAVGDLFAPAAAATAITTAPATAVAAPAPVVVDATGLVKAADMQSAAAAQNQRRAKAAAAPPAPAAKPAAKAAKPVAPATQAEPAKPARPAAPAAANAVGAHAAQVVGGRLSSGFGARGGRMHQGLDIAAPIGTPIHVPLAGTVIDAGPASGFGQWVRVRHGDGTITTYGHVSKFFVKVGQKVAAGEVIAAVGNLGRSTGPHLHIEVTTPAGRKIDPRGWLNSIGVGA